MPPVPAPARVLAQLQARRLVMLAQGPGTQARNQRNRASAQPATLAPLGESYQDPRTSAQNPQTVSGRVWVFGAGVGSDTGIGSGSGPGAGSGVGSGIGLGTGLGAGSGTECTGGVGGVFGGEISM